MSARVHIGSSLTITLGMLTPLYAQPVRQGLQKENLDRLIVLSQAAERSRWWPAVQELGRMAASDAALRGEIWNRARVNTLGMKFVCVETGTFVMGPDLLNIFHIQPAHSVQITRAYYMAVTEVTNAQYRQLFPEFEPDEYSPDPDSPAVRVMWAQADRFCKRLSEREAATYRLPTEAEWEYACRAGSTTRYCFGQAPAEEGRDVLSEYAWWKNPKGRASQVGLLKPNNWGIYDMHGNACEWVADRFSGSYYAACKAQGTVADPKGPASGVGHVLRGASWDVANPLALTSTARCPLPLFDHKPFDDCPVGFRQTVGFRVVREVVEGDER